jgi:hypothetical protein
MITFYFVTTYCLDAMLVCVFVMLLMELNRTKKKQRYLDDKLLELQLERMRSPWIQH